MGVWKLKRAHIHGGGSIYAQFTSLSLLVFDLGLVTPFGEAPSEGFSI